MGIFIVFGRAYGYFHVSYKDPWTGIGILTYKHSKLAQKLNFGNFEPWLLAAPKVNLWFFVMNII